MMNLCNLEAPVSPLLLKFLIGKACSFLAYFEPRNTIVADFPFCLSVVVDSKFGTCGMYWNWMRKTNFVQFIWPPPPFSVVEQMGSHA